MASNDRAKDAMAVGGQVVQSLAHIAPAMDRKTNCFLQVVDGR